MVVLIGLLVGFFILIGGGTFLASKFKKETAPEKEKKGVVIPSDCCGAHEVCEADHLHLPSDEIIYFDDEELDRFKQKKTIRL